MFASRHTCVSSLLLVLLVVVVVCLRGSMSYVVPHRQNPSVRGLGLPQGRLSQAEWTSYNYHEPQGPGTYAFGYDVDEPETGNTQFRQEERLPNGTVIGSYGYVEPDGNVHTVNYISDELGYRVQIENSRDQRGPPKAMPRPAIVNIPQRPTNNLEDRNGLLYNRQPIAVSNQLYTPAVVAPIGLTPSSNLEVPIKDFNRNFASSNFQNGFNNQFYRGQTNANFDFPNVFYVQRT